jgi:hypothetical protein
LSQADVQTKSTDPPPRLVSLEKLKVFLLSPSSRLKLPTRSFSSFLFTPTMLAANFDKLLCLHPRSRSIDEHCSDDAKGNSPISTPSATRTTTLVDVDGDGMRKRAQNGSEKYNKKILNSIVGVLLKNKWIYSIHL